MEHNIEDYILLNFNLPSVDFRTGLRNFINWAITQTVPEDFKDYEKSIIELKEKGLLK